MTREESIAILDGFKHNPLFNEQHFEALDMAISALSELGTKANESIKPYVELAHSVLAENKCFDGTTNGDAIISLYPNLKYTIRNGRVVTTIGVASSFDLEWWNAPYQKGGE